MTTQDDDKEIELCSSSSDCGLTEWSCDRLQDIVYSDNTTERRDLAVQIRKDMWQLLQNYLPKSRVLGKVDRFEVIDDEGRAYVKGSIYGSPVTVKLDVQDEGRTLKVFIEPKKKRRN